MVLVVDSVVLVVASVVVVVAPRPPPPQPHHPTGDTTEEDESTDKSQVSSKSSPNSSPSKRHLANVTPTPVYSRDCVLWRVSKGGEGQPTVQWVPETAIWDKTAMERPPRPVQAGACQERKGEGRGKEATKKGTANCIHTPREFAPPNHENSRVTA